jgi:hypothetical protein
MWVDIHMANRNIGHQHHRYHKFRYKYNPGAKIQNRSLFSQLEIGCKLHRTFRIGWEPRKKNKSNIFLWSKC